MSFYTTPQLDFQNIFSDHEEIRIPKHVFNYLVLNQEFVVFRKAMANTFKNSPFLR